MAQQQNHHPAIIIPLRHQGKGEDKELELGSDEPEAPLPLTAASRVLYMLGDIAAGPAFRFTQWLESVRKRTARNPSSGFPHRPTRLPDAMPSSAEGSMDDPKCDSPPVQTTELSLWERLGNAAMLDIESSSFSWERLSSLHHTEHSSSTEHSEDEMNKALEVTEEAAVIKISSSRMATQSERLGYEFAKWLGIQTPQARVVHNTSPEWFKIKEAAEKARNRAFSEGDEIGEMTCLELLEALELSRCLFFMSYIHGSPLLESSSAFESQESAERTAAALGRVLMLDLVIRNEDRLPCRQLRWRGNSANLLLAEKMMSVTTNSLEKALDSAMNQYRPRVMRALQKERRSTSIGIRMISNNPGLFSQASDISDISESPSCSDMSLEGPTSGEPQFTDIVAIDSGVPRRPPAGKRSDDQANYPKLVELLINSSGFCSNLLHDITVGKLGTPSLEEINKTTDAHASETAAAVHEFRSAFRAALRDLQGFHIFLLTLHQKLDNLLRSFMSIISKISSGDPDKEDSIAPDSPSLNTGEGSCPSPASKDRSVIENPPDYGDSESQRTAPRASWSGNKENSDIASPMSREGWHGKFYKGGDPLRSSLRLTAKLRDFHKYAKVDAESNKELEQWNETLRSDAIKLCQDNNFNTGFFECSDNNSVDAYELKVRLEHILERIALISEAANTEKPSAVTNSLFIGGALAARSVYTLQHLGITHILCLCTNEIGQSDSQFPDLFEYKNFYVFDDVDCNISSIFEEACDFIDHVEQKGQRILVHCFEGRSRSVTLVLAYLMLRKKFPLSEAWNTLKRVHRRAQPNDGREDLTGTG
ncbi:hypothetical protein K1719_046133 [Acacia pycnantha]|nr:hypothetical protein K1719_046133 [Acacia pycnantha]